jgi:hypothetical protein
MRSFEDTRTLPEKAADLEIEQVREQLMQWGGEMADEGESEEMVVRHFCCDLEERLARLYCMYYELSAELEAVQT